MALGISGEFSCRPFEFRRQRRLLRRDPFLPPGLLVAEAKHFLGRIVQVAEELPLPVVPHIRSDGADIDDGEDQEEAQAFRRRDDLGEVEDGLEIGQVALERGRRHQQVIADEPCHGVGLAGGEAKARA